MKKLFLVFLVIMLGSAAGAGWVITRAEGPTVDLAQPVDLIGAAGRLDVQVETPGGRLSALDVSIEQAGRTLPVFSLAQPGPTDIQQQTRDRIRLTRDIGKTQLPDLRAGPARLVVRATRPVLFGLSTAQTVATRDITVRLDPPRVTILSKFHYVNHGGAEFVVYRVSPPEAVTGVEVGGVRYPGFAASGARLGGISIADPSIKVAFFALLYDQDLDAPMEVFAEDEAGNAARVTLEHRAFPGAFEKSRVTLDPRFLDRVVPAILERTPGLAAPRDDRLAAYLAINGDLRRRNSEAIASQAAQTSLETMWSGAFRQLPSSAVQASFADHRTYFYDGQEVDQQVHLGFDLASTANAPVRAGNAGRVLFAEYLGIYGNMVILDHGMGVQSLYAHLSSIGVRSGQTLRQGDEIGRS